MKELKLIFPCKIDWETMPSHETGKYCGECKKTINDYTSAKTEEFKSSSVFCGRFRNDQLSYHRSEYEIKNFKTISLSLLTLLGAIAPGQEMKAQTDEVSKEIVPVKFSNLKFPLKMEGTIRDKSSREVIGNAQVTLIQLGSAISTTKTDSSGYFSFLLLEKDIRDSVFDVRVSYQDTNRYYLADTLLKVPLIVDAIEKNAVFSIDFLVKPVQTVVLTTDPNIFTGIGVNPWPTGGTGGVVAISYVHPVSFSIIPVAADTVKLEIPEAKIEPAPVSRQKIRKGETENSDPKTNQIVVVLVAFVIFLVFRFNKFKLW